MPSKLDPHLTTIESWLATEPQITALAIARRLAAIDPATFSDEQHSIVQRLHVWFVAYRYGRDPEPNPPVASPNRTCARRVLDGRSVGGTLTAARGASRQNHPCTRVVSERENHSGRPSRSRGRPDMARPAHKPEPVTRRQVEAIAGYGVPEADIARVIGIDPKTLRKHYRDELDTGHVKANAKVAENLFRKAPATAGRPSSPPSSG
jgi:hypothetical protein